MNKLDKTLYNTVSVNIHDNSVKNLTDGNKIYHWKHPVQYMFSLHSYVQIIITIHKIILSLTTD